MIFELHGTLAQLLDWDFSSYLQMDAYCNFNTFVTNTNCVKWNGILHQIKQWWRTQGFLNENCGLIILLPWRKFHYKPFFPNIIIYFLPWEFFEKKRKMCNCVSAIRCIASKTGLFANFFQSHDNEIIKVKCEAGRTIKILHFWLVHNVCMIRELLISWTLRSKGQRSIIIILGLKPLEISTSKFSNNKKWYSFLRWVKVAVCQGEN